MTDVTPNERKRIEDLEEAVLLILRATGAHAPDIVALAGHGADSVLVHRANVEWTDARIQAKTQELEAKQSDAKTLQAEIEALKIRRAEMEVGLL